MKTPNFLKILALFRLFVYTKVKLVIKGENYGAYSYRKKKLCR